MQNVLTYTFGVLRKSFTELGNNDPLRLAGATAFFTTFALPAILMLVLQLTRLFLPKQESSEQLYTKISKYVGEQTSALLINVLRGYEKIASHPLAIVSGIIFLLF